MSIIGINSNLTSRNRSLSVKFNRGLKKTILSSRETVEGTKELTSIRKGVGRWSVKTSFQVQIRNLVISKISGVRPLIPRNNSYLTIVKDSEKSPVRFFIQYSNMILKVKFKSLYAKNKLEQELPSIVQVQKKVSTVFRIKS